MWSHGFVCVDIVGETALVNKIPLIENRIQNLAWLPSAYALHKVGKKSLFSCLHQALKKLPMFIKHSIYCKTMDSRIHGRNTGVEQKGNEFCSWRAIIKTQDKNKFLDVFPCMSTWERPINEIECKPETSGLPQQNRWDCKKPTDWPQTYFHFQVCILRIARDNVNIERS